MASIRKTKKQLKREIAELNEDWRNSTLTGFARYLFGDTIYRHIQMLKQELANLRQKNQCGG